jgi:flagellar biosynthesis protein FlhG
MSIKNRDGFFIRIANRDFGPVSLAELKYLVRRGDFTSDDLIWNESKSEWENAGRIDELKDCFHSQNGRRYQNKLYAVASGKGGVGKTVLSASMGVALAASGREVIMVDGDLGGPDLHTCMGILEPPLTFFDFYTLQKDSLNDIVIDTPVKNLRMISGSCGTLGVANPKFFQKQRFIRELKTLKADYIILDLGAGADFNVIDFFLLAEEKLLVATPEPTSLHEAFGFIKICLLRELTRALKGRPAALAILAKDEVNRPGKIRLTIAELLKEIETVDAPAGEIFRQVLASFRPRLILNMVKEPDEIKEGLAIQAAARELLSVTVQYWGHISLDPKVGEAVKDFKPFLIYDPNCAASQELSALLRQM